MTNKTRKRFLPVALVMAIAAIGVMAVAIALAGAPVPREAEAHGGSPGDCSTDAGRAIHDLISPNDPCPEPTTPTPEPTATPTPMPAATAPPAAPGADALDIGFAYGTGAVKVSWDAVDDAAEYLVQYRECTDASCAGIALGDMTVTATEATIPRSSLDTREIHQIIVTAMGADGKVLAQSNPGMVCPAAAPTGLKVEALDNAARLSWKDPVDPYHMIEVMGFQIERVTYLQDSNNPILTNNRMATIDLGEPVNQHWDLGLSYGVTYTYRVRAEVQITDSAGNRMMGYSLWSDPETVIVADSGGRLTPLEEAPSVVRSLKAVPACADTITVTWAAPEDMGIIAARRDKNGVYVGPDFIGGEGAGKVEQGEKATSVTYQVQRMVNNGPWMPVMHDGMMYVDMDVAYPAEKDDPPNVYAYRVRAMNEANLYGPWTMVEEELTEPARPVMPENLVYQQVGGTVELEWQMPRDSDALWRDHDFKAGQESTTLEYVLERKIGESGTWTEIARVNHKYADRFDDRRTQTHGDPVRDIPNLQEQEKVSYRVSALVNECNRSPAHQRNAITVAVAPPDPVGVPTGLSAMSAGAGSVTITWNAAANATAQWVYGHNYATGQGDYVASVTGDATSATVTGLASGNYVFIAVAGQTEGDDTSYSGWSNWSELVTVE